MSEKNKEENKNGSFPTGVIAIFTCVILVAAVAAMVLVTTSANTFGNRNECDVIPQSGINLSMNRTEAIRVAKSACRNVSDIPVAHCYPDSGIWEVTMDAGFDGCQNVCMINFINDSTSIQRRC